MPGDQVRVSGYIKSDLRAVLEDQVRTEDCLGIKSEFGGYIEGYSQNKAFIEGSS